MTKHYQSISAHRRLKLRAAPLLLLSSASLAGCSTTFRPPQIGYDDIAVPAILKKEQAKPVKIVSVPKPLPLPGQLKPISDKKAPEETGEPTQRVNQANAAARIEPVKDGFINAVQVYPYSSGALYQVYTAPGQITDVALQDGEQLVGSGPVAAGDTVRWIIGDTESGPLAATTCLRRRQESLHRFPAWDLPRRNAAALYHRPRGQNLGARELPRAWQPHDCRPAVCRSGATSWRWQL